MSRNIFSSVKHLEKTLNVACLNTRNATFVGVKHLLNKSASFRIKSQLLRCSQKMVGNRVKGIFFRIVRTLVKFEEII